MQCCGVLGRQEKSIVSILSSVNMYIMQVCMYIKTYMLVFYILCFLLAGVSGLSFSVVL